MVRYTTGNLSCLPHTQVGAEVKQLDLIVAALKEYTEIVATAGTDYRVCCGGDVEFDHLDDCLAMKALAAAKELKENLNLEQFAEFIRSIKEQK
jgi:hypothetical protein